MLPVLELSLGVVLLMSPASARAESPATGKALAALNSVHAINEVALSPDGKRLVYGRVVRGRYWNALQRLGVKTEFVVYPDEGHLFFKHEDQVDVMTRLVGWFDQYLKPAG